MISRSAEYAIRSMVYLASTADRLVLNREIAASSGLPPQFLTKLLATLTREGLLISQRGKTGGFRLARPPEEITLFEIVSLFDPRTVRPRCILGRPECSETKSCSIHALWAPLQESFRKDFARTVLADLIASSRGKRRPAARARIRARGRRKG